MQDGLIADELVLPLLIVVALVLVVFSVRIGWSVARMGVRRREAALQKDLRDARLAGPKNESMLRGQEQTIARLQDQVGELRQSLAARPASPTNPLRTAPDFASSELAAAEEMIKALQRQAAQRDRSIADLNVQITKLAQQKDMAEDLAHRRSQSNRSLKDARTDLEASAGALEQSVAEHARTIADREASIHRLLEELQQCRQDLRNRESRLETLTRDNLAQSEALAEARSDVLRLEQSIAGTEAHGRD